ncbi:hypothetical protein [Caulobacter sp. RHG1]|uniref:hypothetical protein n=1 Tax=Caulobacter sp. (strain RHG1) TaxID=2545762 RepID=UPI001556A826|nr:hypothetical protein [Caulobacter sp. RHG1]NQE63989.1 hypothetical protein [Caulobacter sp. RHG1]
MTSASRPTFFDRCAVPATLVGLSAAAFLTYKLSAGERAPVAVWLVGVCLSLMLLALHKARALSLPAVTFVGLSSLVIGIVGAAVALNGLG